MNIKIIGIGGVGGILLPILAKYLNYYQKESSITMTAIDGDAYEDENKTRQFFHRIGNKAEVSIERIKSQFPDLICEFKAEYITTDNIEYLIEERDILFLAVDNHKTRLLVSDFCENYLDDAVLISGGNEYIDGNMQIYIRKEGENITLPIANSFHPEIQNPKDKSPDELGCEEIIESEPQLIFTNNFIAAIMLNAFYAHLQCELKYDEVYADIITNNCRSVARST